MTIDRVKPRVVYWNNMPSPYVVGRFNALARRGNLDFEAWFNVRREADRSWEVTESEWLFRARYMAGKGTKEPGIWNGISQLKKAAPDLLVSLYDSPSFVIGSIAAKSLGARTAFRCLPTYDTWIRRTYWKEGLKHFLFRTVDGVKVPGPAGESMALKYGASPERICHVTQTIDVDHFAKARAILESDRLSLRKELGVSGCVFVYVGRLFEGKGIRYLMEAFKSVRAEIPDASLLILGDGTEQSAYRDTARSIPGIVFSGFIQQADLPRYYAAADVFVFPTLGDPHGIVVEEAMAAGLAVISSSSAGDIALRLPDGVAGFIVPPANSEALANRMMALARDPGLRKQFSATSTRLVELRRHEQWAIDFESFVGRTLSQPKRSSLAARSAWLSGLAIRSCAVTGRAQ